MPPNPICVDCVCSSKLLLFNFFQVCRYLYLHFICIGARVDGTIYMEVLYVTHSVRELTSKEVLVSQHHPNQHSTEAHRSHKYTTQRYTRRVVFFFFFFKKHFNAEIFYIYMYYIIYVEVQVLNFASWIIDRSSWNAFLKILCYISDTNKSMKVKIIIHLKDLRSYPYMTRMGVQCQSVLG